jgi:exosortase B
MDQPVPSALRDSGGRAATPMRAHWQQWAPWLPIILGLAVMYVPSLYDLFTGIWSTDENMHGPIVLGISVWLLHRNWGAMEEAAKGKNKSSWGWPIFVFGLLTFVLGRSQSLLVPEMGSLILITSGLILLIRGSTALRAQWFALFFMLFMVPLPGFIVDAVTMPMKMAVSFVAEQILYLVGYPIARTGVILQIGQYMLLVADACAGLHTLLTLEALGLLYLNIVRRDSVFRNLWLAILVVPISFTANVIRVMSLSLITYHFGDAAGQGFLHKFAGMVLFLSALILIIGFDNLLQLFEKRLSSRAAGMAALP